MRVFVTGATGLIGTRVSRDRLQRGDEVVALSRDAARARETLPRDVEIVEGDPKQAGDWQERIDGCDAVVHLAGAGVADRRWTAAYKKIIRDSRVESTRRVAEAINGASSPPAVLVNASAVGYYGDRGEEPLDESASPGSDFLADLVVEWEDAARRARARVVRLRTGIVLDPRGATLGRLLPVFRLGLGGPIGLGRQWFPWVHWRDVVGLVDLALRDGGVAGPVNAAASGIVRNKAFARALGRALHRPAVLPVPVFVLRVAIGELASYAAASQRVVPAAALGANYRFVQPELGPALEDLVARS